METKTGALQFIENDMNDLDCVSMTSSPDFTIDTQSVWTRGTIHSTGFGFKLQFRTTD